MILDAQSKAFLHVYPNLAGLGEKDRRDILRTHTGCASASDDGFFKHTFEAAMAAYEAILWQRVEMKIVPDPRACTVCGRRMIRTGKGKKGACPEGCETRNITAWETHDWRRNITRRGMASSAAINKLRELWTMLLDYLPPDEQNDTYLHGIIKQAAHKVPAGLLLGGCIQWQDLPSPACSLAIEAIKDRLRHAVKRAA